MCRVLCIALAALAGCSGAARVSPPAAEALEVTASGVTATPTGFSVGLAVRNPARTDAVGIELSLELLDASGAGLRTVTERLAYCPAEHECLWGSAFTGDVAPGAPVAGVRGRAVAASWEPASRSVPFVLAGRRPDGAVAGQAPPHGTVYVVSIVEGVPRAGAFRRTSAEPTFVVPGDLVPPAPGEVIRAVFYADAMPAGE